MSAGTCCCERQTILVERATCDPATGGHFLPDRWRENEHGVRKNTQVSATRAGGALVHVSLPLTGYGRHTHSIQVNKSETSKMRFEDMAVLEYSQYV